MKRAWISVLLVVGCDSAGGPESVDFRLHAATVAQECQWPAVAVIDDDRFEPCSATLIHPQALLTAAGCLESLSPTDPHRVWFGEVASSPTRMATIDSCTPHPDAGTADNLAVCVLTEPVNDVPIAPILHASEPVRLAAGTDVTIVGFGLDRIGHDGQTFLMPYGAGRKRHAVHEITGVNGVFNSLLVAGPDDSNACYGDFGGPAMVQLPGGGWRVVGVLTRGGFMAEAADNVCQGSVDWFSILSNRIDWIEDVTGFDVTPCHDEQGDPVASPECDAAPTHIGDVGAVWMDDCSEPLTPGGSSSSGGGADGTTTTGMVDVTTSFGGDDTTGGPGETGQPSASPPDDAGCGCRTTPRAAPLALLFVALLRRRREVVASRGPG